MLHFLSGEDLLFLKSNVSSNLDLYKEEKNDWIVQEFLQSPFIPYKREFQEIILDPEKSEVDNARILFSALKDLSPSDATDERFWAGLAHGALWEYMRESSKKSLEDNPRLSLDETFVKNRYFFNLEKNGHKRSLYINGLSKLWWAGKMTYDDSNAKDPFRYLNLFETAFSHKLINTFSSSFMASETVRFALFECGLYLKEQGIPIKGDTLVPMMKHLNELGGSMILDVMEREELQEKLIDFAIENLDEVMAR